ncbi:MAG: hypothetical protein JWM82_2275 [Myxococcales bacterium]|nr:hypothetical protein [Myxococcales bacterium]
MPFRTKDAQSPWHMIASMRMNKQGVRDLNDFGKKKPKPEVAAAAEPAAAEPASAHETAPEGAASPAPIVEHAPAETVAADA